MRVVRFATTWAVIVIGVGLIAITVLVPRLGGAEPYTVLTGSMRPALPPGTLVVVRPVPIKQIGVGDVVTYQLRSGKPEVVTHRVLSIGDNRRYGRVLQTKGDANNTPDQAWVIGKQVRGRLWYAVPFVGRFINVLTGRQREAAVWLIGAALLAYAGVMFAGAFRDRRKQGAASTRGVT
jgi:signal peptidase